MPFSYIRQTIICASLVLALSACAASPQNHYYVLTPAHSSNTTLAGATNITTPTVSVSLPAYLDRAQLVFIDPQGNVNIHEFDRWAEPIDAMIQRVLVQDLQQTLPFSKSPVKSIMLTVDDFYFNDGQATLKAHWTMASANSGHGSSSSASTAATSYDFDSITPSTTRDLTGLVEAMSENVGQLAQKISASRR